MVDPSFIPATNIPADTQKHSKIGIASFVVGIVALLIFCLAIVLAFGYGVTLASQNRSFQVTTGNTTVLTLGLMIFISPALSLVGAVLGFVAVFQKNSKKLFGILGLVLNMLTILAFCVLLVIGLAGQSRSLGLY
jgi:hypothetical protein